MHCPEIYCMLTLGLFSIDTAFFVRQKKKKKNILIIILFYLSKQMTCFHQPQMRKAYCNSSHSHRNTTASALLCLGCKLSQTVQYVNNCRVLSKRKTGLRKVKRQIAKAQQHQSCVSDRMAALIHTL